MRHTVLLMETGDWLIDQALGDPEIHVLFGALCERLHAIGIPVERASLSWPVLHPLFRAEHVNWKLGKGAELTQFRHDTGKNEAWLSSPFYHVVSRGIPRLRRRLTGNNVLIDFPVLEDLVEQGYTDYLATTQDFSIAEFKDFSGGATGIIATWATRREAGFSDDDITSISRIQRWLAVACHAAIQKRVMANIATTYLGPTAGWRVLSGDIRRGDGEQIPAVVWFSDLRGSTALSETMPPQDYLALLNTYYECTAQSVVDHGGEILNFIGDGVLAIFPILGEDRLAAAVAQATAAAADAHKRCAAIREDRSDSCRGLQFGTAITAGKVMFGNIGIPERLAFSGTGRVVNEVHRIEQATKILGVPVLGTAKIAATAPDTWRSVGLHDMPGVGHEIELFAPVWASEIAEQITIDRPLQVHSQP